MKKHFINKFFTWHKYPDDKELDIKSIAEILFYLLIFVVLVYLFSSFNKVNVRKAEIEVEDLYRYYSYTHHHYRRPFVQVNCLFPMTRAFSSYSDYDFTDTLGNDISYKYKYATIFFEAYDWNNQKNGKNELTDSSSLFWQFIYKNDRIENLLKLEIEKRNPSYQGDSRIFTHIPRDVIDLAYKKLYENKDIYLLDEDVQRTYDRYENSILKSYFNYQQSQVGYDYKFNRIDSLRALYYQLSCDTLIRGWYPEKLLYHKTIVSRGKSLFFFPNRKEELYKDTVSNNSYYIKKRIRNKESYGLECWRSGDFAIANSFGKRIVAFDMNLWRLPKWWSLEDVSQSYYNISLKSSTIDSLHLNIDYLGAVEFSEMQPVPDRISMSGIEFTDPIKIVEIKQNGLRFHVRFKELENMQYIRLFGITAILSGLLMIFLTFIFFGMFGFGRHLRNIYSENKLEKTKNICKNKKGEITNTENT